MQTDERQRAWAALRMIAEAVGELFGPVASIESEEASLLRGPEYHHMAEGIIEALQRVKDALAAVPADARGTDEMIEAARAVKKLDCVNVDEYFRRVLSVALEAALGQPAEPVAQVKASAEIASLREQLAQAQQELAHLNARAEVAEAEVARMRSALEKIAGEKIITEKLPNENRIMCRDDIVLLARSALTSPVGVSVRDEALAKPLWKVPASELTDAQLDSEEAYAQERFDNRPEHGGSPGEFWWERLDEIATERKRRALKGGAG